MKKIEPRAHFTTKPAQGTYIDLQLSRNHRFAFHAFTPDICCITNQPPLSSIIKSCRLTGHLARMDENADASQAIFKPPPENWKRPTGRPCTTWMKNIHDDLTLLDLGMHEARDLVQNRPLCRLMSLHRSFAVAGPRVWNSLPGHLRDEDITYSSFRRELKTYWFSCNRGAM